MYAKTHELSEKIRNEINRGPTIFEYIIELYFTPN